LSNALRLLLFQPPKVRPLQTFIPGNFEHNV
jgi:hypothetical protein